jgi:hypothetical protein
VALGGEVDQRVGVDLGATGQFRGRSHVLLHLHVTGQRTGVCGRRPEQLDRPVDLGRVGEVCDRVQVLLGGEVTEPRTGGEATSELEPVGVPP